MQCPKCKAEIDEELAICSQCNHSLEKEKTAKKIYWPATLSVSCVLAVVAVYIAAILIAVFGIDVGNAVEEFAPVFGFGLLVAASVIGILALLKIYRSNNALGGKRRAIKGIVVSSCFLAMMVPMAPLNYSSMMARRVVCGTNLKGLGTVMAVYAGDNNGRLPTGENWCDLLIENADVSPKSFRCSASYPVEGESSYCFNEDAAGKKFSQLPEDLVLLFEAGFTPDEGEIRVPIKSRKSFDKYKVLMEIFSGDEKVYLDCWNQVGGPELLMVDNHEPRGCNVLFVNGDMKFVKLKRLAILRWKIEGEEAFPAELFSSDEDQFLIKNYVVMFTSLVVLAVTFVILRKYWTRKHFAYSLVLGLISAAVGCFFGLLAESLYQKGDVRGVGIIAGGILGFVVGICYASILNNASYSIKQQKDFKGYALSLGMLTGMICSTVVHLVLMIMHEEKRPFGMITGLTFGMIAGILLGWISSRIYARRQVGEVMLKEEGLLL